MKKALFTALPLCLALAFAGGCTSTDVVDPPAGSDSNVVTINLSAPDAYRFTPTRAEDTHKGHTLRYVAKLYKGSKIAAGELFAKKEILGNTGTITFVTPETGTYTVAVFADYISAAASADADGHYPDRYYDTTGDGEHIQMLSFNSNDKSTRYEYNSINNDNYDCFAKVEQIEKGDQAYEKPIVLKRVVSKVCILNDNTVKGSRPEGVESIKLTKFSFMSQHNLTMGYSTEHTEAADLSEMEFTPNNEDELFYFYTFGCPKGYGPAEIAFEIKGKTDINGTYTYNPASIPGSSFQPKANYVIRVTGNFFIPKNAPALDSDKIILSVSSDQNWDGSNNVNL